MIKYLCVTILIMSACLLGTVNAFAGNFTGQDVKNVIQSMQDIDSEKLPKVMVSLNDFSEGNYENVMDADGNLVVFGNMFEAAKMSLGDYRHLQTISLANGFATVEDWAEKSDAILMVFVRMQMSIATMEGLAAITPEQMEAFPKNDRVDIFELKKMIGALLALPQDDIDIFAPYEKEYASSLK